MKMRTRISQASWASFLNLWSQRCPGNLASGAVIGSIWLNTRADVSAETEVSDVTCGSPGTNSYLDSEGFCDCKAGYTWVNESIQIACTVLLQVKDRT